MKNAIIISLILLILLTACTSNENSINTTIKEDSTINDTLIEEKIIEPTIKEEPIKEEKIEEQPITKEIELIIPNDLNILLDEVELLKELYGQDEEYELTMILSTTQYDRIATGELRFTPLCDEPTRIIISINKELIYNELAKCEETTLLQIGKGLLEKGPNSILFQSKVTEAYELTNTALLFTYTDGTKEDLDADNFIFEPSNEELKNVKNLGIVALSNGVERTFTLTEEQLLNEYYVSFESVEREGKLIIQLNGRTIYSGTPRKITQKIKLPAEYLMKGKNSLTFIGTDT